MIFPRILGFTMDHVLCDLKMIYTVHSNCAQNTEHCFYLWCSVLIHPHIKNNVFEIIRQI